MSEKLQILNIDKQPTNTIIVNSVDECNSGVNVYVQLNSLENAKSYIIETQQISSSGYVEINPNVYSFTNDTSPARIIEDIYVRTQSDRYFIIKLVLKDTNNNIFDSDSVVIDCLSVASLLTPTPTTTNTNTPTVTPTPTYTPTNTATTTNTPTYTQTMTGTSELLFNSLYQLADDPEFLCQLYPEELVYSLNNRVINTILCNNEENLLQLELVNLNVGDKYTYSFGVYLPRHTGSVKLSPKQDTFVAVDTFKNVETVIRYTRSDMLIIKFELENNTKSEKQSQFFILTCKQE